MTNQYPGWEFVEELGGGSFGKVYKARKSGAFGEDTYSAIKVITIPEGKSEISSYKDDGMDDESITALLNDRVKGITTEFKLLSKLRGNTNVVSYEDHEVIPHEDGQGWDIYIRMELLTALPNYIQGKFGSGMPDGNTVIKLGIDMCKALELCQKYNIIHRDIKPQNIFVNDNGDFKLGDFGIAKTSDHSTRATKTGTYTYMAPEVYKGLPYHHHVDIYSLGLVLYWLLNERRGPFLVLPPEPLRAADMDEALNRRMAGQPLPAPKHGSDDLKRVVLKACAFQPRDRWANATEMREALEAVLAGRPVKIAPAVAPNVTPAGGTVRVQRPPVAPQAPMDATVGVRRAPVSQNNADRQPVPPVARQPQKKKSKGWIFAVIAAVLAVAVLAGAGYWFFLRDDDPFSESYVPTVSNPNVEPGTTAVTGDVAGTVIEEARPEQDEDLIYDEYGVALVDKYGFDKLDLVCFNGGNEGLWDEMVDLFLECYPGVEVTTDFSDDVANRISSRMLTETPPDFVSSSGEEWNMTDSARAGQLMDLTEFYYTGVNADGVPLTDVLPKESLTNSYVDDILTTLPTSTTYLGWWYNVGMFEELGIKAPTTWDELYEASEVLIANGITPLLYQNPSYGYWALSNQLMAVWGGMETFNKCYITLEEGAWLSTEAKAAIAAQEELVKAGILTYSTDFTVAQVDFLNGRVGMITNGTWFENEMSNLLPDGFEMAFLPIPAATEGGNRAVVSITSGGGQIPANCANPKAAKAFIGVMLSDAGQAIIAKYGTMPISTSMDLAVVADFMTAGNLSALKAAQQDDVLVLPFVEGYYSDMNAVLRACNDDLCLGDVTAEEYCERMEATAEMVRNDPDIIMRTVK